MATYNDVKNKLLQGLEASCRITKTFEQRLQLKFPQNAPLSGLVSKHSLFSEQSASQKTEASSAKTTTSITAPGA